MKKHFITGVVILLPLVLTFLVVRWAVNLLTRPFVGIIRALFEGSGAIPAGVVTTVSQIAALALFFFIALFLGFVARGYIIQKVVTLAEKLFHRIPLIGKVYKACKEVVDNLFHSSAASFQQVVYVPYPHKNSLAIGLVARDELITDKKLLPVFVPGTPNPTMGFVLLFDRADLTYTDLSVRQAMQLLVSCGAKKDPYTVLGDYNVFCSRNERFLSE